MAPSSCFYMSIHFLFLCLWSHSIGAHNLSRSVKPLCLEDEMSALLQFKERYKIADAFDDHLTRPKTLSWKNSQDCCSWDGIECDENTGHVIALDLGSSFLYGSINNNSTLFQLAHLKKLNLGDNDFNYSQIPSRVGDLSRLTHLNLSASFFSGRIPLEIFKLTRLVYLNLCCNDDPCAGLLEMKASGLRSLVQNLTSLEELSLGTINMSSKVPNTLANLSSLRRLDMDECQLHGVFPAAIFHLPKLRYLGVGHNKALTGRLLDFNSSSPLEELQLYSTSFSGELSSSIGTLPSLSYLDATKCKFSGSIPASFANLSNLKYLGVSTNPLTAQSISSLSWVWKIKKLTTLDLFHNNLYGEIPPSIRNLSHLVELHLVGNQLSGTILSQLMNLTQLTLVNLKQNKFYGEIPSSIYQLQNLQALALAKNDFSGTVELDNFLKLKQLNVLQLSSNRLACRTSSVNVVLPRLQVLGLASCNLREFSAFLQNQKGMNWLDLSVTTLVEKCPFGCGMALLNTCST